MRIVQSRLITHFSSILVMVLSTMAGCGERGSTPSAESTGDGASGGYRYTLAVIPKGTMHEFWKTVEIGARQAGKDLNVEIKWDGPTAETEHDRQQAILDAMVNTGVNGVAIAPTDQQALKRPVERVIDRGIPVVVFDSNLNTDRYVSFVATDNKKGGTLAGRKLVELMGAAGGKVILLRYTEGSGSTLNREQGFLEAVTKQGGIEVVDKQFTDGSTAGALTVATNMLSRLVENNELPVEGIFASNLPTSLGMLDALDRLRKQGVKVHAKFVGFDSSKKLVNGLKAGQIDALVVQNPKRMGYLAVQTLVDHLEGKPVEKFVDTGVEVVTKSRLSEPAIRDLVGLGKP